jgi:hypothetical protein
MGGLPFRVSDDSREEIKPWVTNRCRGLVLRLKRGLMLTQDRPVVEDIRDRLRVPLGAHTAGRGLARNSRGKGRDTALVEDFRDGDSAVAVGR